MKKVNTLEIQNDPICVFEGPKKIISNCLRSPKLPHTIARSIPFLKNTAVNMVYTGSRKIVAVTINTDSDYQHICDKQLIDPLVIEKVHFQEVNQFSDVFLAQI